MIRKGETDTFVCYSFTGMRSDGVRYRWTIFKNRGSTGAPGVKLTPECVDKKPPGAPMRNEKERKERRKKKKKKVVELRIKMEQANCLFLLAVPCSVQAAVYCTNYRRTKMASNTVGGPIMVRT